MEFRYRAEYILSKILSENDMDSTIAIISHGGMINQLYQAFVKIPVESGIFFGTGDTGIHEWRFNGTERYIIKANSMMHLMEKA